ncbi:MAG: galactokinase [Gaiellaceae bacterium MAG52_C11]|nr:galactokinase [Candidatus Gaiellasilicea maunaloa]
MTAELAARVRSAFAARSGYEPAGLWWAPGRVNLIGEHTDYNDGYVFPFAIELGTVAAAARRDDGRLRCWSLEEDAVGDVSIAELEPGRVDGWTAYPQGMAWALHDAGIGLTGADVLVGTTLPLGSGLSSSAALECAVGLALAELHGARIERRDLALLAQRAETEVAGVPSGAMDQLAAMLGREGHAICIDTRTLHVDAVPLELGDAGFALVVIDTHVPRRLADGAYGERRAQCGEAARILGVPTLRDVSPEEVEAGSEDLGDVLHRRARHVTTENERVLDAVEALRARDLPRVGELLHASHASLRDDYEVSAVELDLAVTAATDAGALGARMTGAGFGGCALALVAADRVAAVGAAVADAFTGAGLAEPSTFEVAPAGGARRHD